MRFYAKAKPFTYLLAAKIGFGGNVKPPFLGWLRGGWKATISGLESLISNPPVLRGSRGGWKSVILPGNLEFQPSPFVGLKGG